MRIARSTRQTARCRRRCATLSRTTQEQRQSRRTYGSWEGKSTPMLRQLGRGSARHYLAIEVPGRVAEHGQDDDETNEQGYRPDH